MGASEEVREGFVQQCCPHGMMIAMDWLHGTVSLSVFITRG